MRFTSITAAATLGAGFVSAVPMRRQADAPNACANITAQYQEAIAANATSFFADGEVAYNCLNSMPFNSELASAFVLEYKKYLQFQSTIPVLKNPPKTYLSQPVDLLGGLDAIYQKANTSQYQSQFQMDTELNNLLFSANDGHLNALPCSLLVFAFQHTAQLVSISSDGVALPLLYQSTDAFAMQNGSTDVSDIVTINGMDAVQYVQKLGSLQQNQDPDAQWNDIFPSAAKGVAGGNPDGAFVNNNGFWPGAPEIVLGYRNGSFDTSRIVASVRLRNFNYTDGEDLWNNVCLPADTTSEPEPEPTSSEVPTTTSEAPSTSSSVRPTATAGPPMYPTPVIRDPYNTIMGFYLDGEQNDTAVLFIPTFTLGGEGLPDWVEATFAEVASTFVNGSIADGKTKMIIDVSGNPGGVILAGFDLFKLFFPDLEPYSATRLRDHPAEQLTIKAQSTINATEYSDLATGPFYYGSQVAPDQNTTFDSWEEFYGPDVINGANMSSLYANFIFEEFSTEEQPIRGYGGIPLNVSSRPFAKENLLIVSDGYCTSTCTTFVTLMTDPDLGGVASIAFGGRPINAPMQIMGGVRGAQSTQWAYLSSLIEGSYQYALNTTNTTEPVLTSEELELFAQVKPNPLETFPLRLSSGNLNLRNAYAPESDELPLQFAYQAADCKIFYTFENVLKPGTTWTAAAAAAWGDGSCVAGSTNTTIASS